LAVVRIDADRLHAAEFGNSDATEVGDVVFALGNPFRLAGTVSRGIISGKGRHSVAIGGVVYQGFLQTDAVINPGNSGGPLVNARGEVVGVNTAIATESGHYDGVGFAIPSTRVAEVLPKLVRGEKIERGFLGILPLSVTEDPEQAAELGWTERYGVLVERVVPGTGAEAAGLQVNDIVIRLDGVRMEGRHHLVEAIGQIDPGSVVSLEIWRNAERMTVEADLGVRPDPPGP
jgi:serine protease Do